MPTLGELEQVLNILLAAQPQATEEPHGVIASGAGRVTRLGLALEPWPMLADWVAQHRLDGLLLHRPWGLQRGPLSPSLAILAYHQPFDRELSIGYNLLLAEELKLQAVQPLVDGSGRRAAMLGELPAQSWRRLYQAVEQVFRGLEHSSQPAAPSISRIAVASAMSDWLVRAAAAAGAQVYLTGQMRVSAAAAVAHTGIGVFITGHERAERWGLRRLAHLLWQHWPGLNIVIAGE